MHTFRLRFSTASIRAFDSASASIEVQLPGLPQPALLTTGTETPIRDCRTLVLKCSGFPTPESAQAAGEQLRATLRVALAELGIGADVSDKRSTLQFSQAVQGAVAKLGGSLAGDSNGLRIYPDDSPPGLVSLTASAFLVHPLDRVLARLQTRYGTVSLDLPDLETAFELFGLSFFESTPRARFLTLITAIEAVAPVELRPESSIAHLEELIALTKAEEDLSPDKVKLISALGNMRRESIATACSRFVAQYGSASDVEAWERLHSIRHKLSHAGVSRPDLSALQGELQSLVQRILLAAAGTSPAEA